MVSNGEMVTQLCSNAWENLACELTFAYKTHEKVIWMKPHALRCRNILLDNIWHIAVEVPTNKSGRAVSNGSSV